MSGGASVWQIARAVAWRSTHNYFTNPALLLPSLVFPLFFFAAFAGGLSAVAEVPGFNFPDGYTAFQFVFVLLQSSAFAGVFAGFGIARDFEQGFARRLMLAARRREGIVLGYALAAVLRAGFTMVVITAVALLVGMQVGGDGIELVGLYGLALLINLVAILWASGVAMRVRSLQGGPLIQMPVFLLLFLAPVYVPLDLLSGWVHAVATVNPVTLLLDTGRDLISGTPVAAGLAFAALAALLAVFTAWALSGLRRAERAGS